MEETVSGFVSGADALRRARDGGRRDAAPVASRAPDDARSTERRTCMTGMSMTVFIPLMPRTVVSVMVPGKSTDRSPRERKDRTRSVRVTRAARAASARLSVRRGGARGEVSLARRGRGGRRKSAQMTGVGAYATGLSWRVRRERCGTAQSGRQRVCPYETRSLLCHCIDTPIDANSQKTNSPDVSVRSLRPVTLTARNRRRDSTCVLPAPRRFARCVASARVPRSARPKVARFADRRARR
jgi:hypothetical protein